MANDRCENACRVCAATDQLLKLWDGNKYCESCVAGLSKRLLEAIRNGEPISEQMPDYGEEVAKRVVWHGRLAILAWMAMCLISGVCVGGLRALPVSALCAVVVAAVSGFPVVWIVSRGVRRLFAEVRTTVAVLDGVVSVENERGVVSFPLEHVRWRTGWLREAKLEGKELVGWRNVCFLPNQKVLLLTTYGKRKRVKHSVAVGFTDSSAELWKSFLSLARIPSDDS